MDIKLPYSRGKQLERILYICNQAINLFFYMITLGDNNFYFPDNNGDFSVFYFLKLL
jgi:hypothetical protein